jgi:hypothetical protein
MLIMACADRRSTIQVGIADERGLAFNDKFTTPIDNLKATSVTWVRTIKNN